jgi:UDP-GlcNAc3NAcA epimerase
MKIVSIVGARPQFIKAAALSRKLRLRHTEVLVHTGQHYDDNMSTVFFEELEIPKPNYNLDVGSGPHGRQTADMLERVERVMIQERPEWVIVYGDTNSTLAGALAAAKLQIPVAHVEAGLRSFNRAMPEEINRILADKLSSLLLCPSQTAVDNLAREGVADGIHLVGDIMADVLQWTLARIGDSSGILNRLAVNGKRYLLATLHRAENTDSPERLQSILSAFNHIEEDIIFPMHPRTQKVMSGLGLQMEQHVRVVSPVGYIDMVTLEKNARLILTDSGGIQKEAYWLSVPCVTLRNETEWVETAETGWNTLVGADPAAIMEAVHGFAPPQAHPPLYGDGHTGTRCIAALETQDRDGCVGRQG